MTFHGAITALITPFKNGTIDEQAYQDMSPVECLAQIETGTPNNNFNAEFDKLLNEWNRH